MDTKTGIPGLSDAARSIRSEFDVDRILLFGSNATGDVNDESDIDLCIVLNSRRERLLTITRSLRLDLFHRLNRSIDIIVYDKATFEERLAAGGALETAIARHGISL